MVSFANEGGLGVINLKKHNEALMMKNIHKFLNKQDIPWVTLVWEKLYPNGKLPNHTMKGSFWSPENLKILPSYKELS